ncbi:MAG: L-histidine N(alpha)-methyltransferase, partial [Planctomycetota bacterium]
MNSDSRRDETQLVAHDRIPDMTMDTLIDRDRFLLIGTPAEADHEVFGRMVREGLSSDEKSLPCRFLYDARGSELFEKICGLPEYYPTRCEAEILKDRSAEIAKLFVGRSEHEV